MKRISIITVCYNAENIIEETIKSVISQTYLEYEYIIIDGQSTDKTLNIISKYKDKIACIHTEKDNGIYDAMNKGIAKSTGEWINFMNAGDKFASPKTLYNIFVSEKRQIENADIIYGDTIAFTKIGEKYIKCKKPFWKNTAFVHGKGICHQSIFIRLDLVKKYPFDISLKICADYKMVYNLYINGYKFTYLPLPIAKYEVENGFSKKHEIQAYQESAIVLGVNKKFYFKLLLFLFSIKKTTHRFLSYFTKLFCPRLHRYIKKKRL